MGANVQATINLKTLLDVSGVKGAVGNIQKALSGLTLPKNLGGNIERAMTKIAHEFTSVEQLQAKGFGTMEDANSVLKSGGKILKYYDDMAASIRQLGLLSDKELGNLFPKKLTDNIRNAKKALSDYTKEVKANADEQKKLEDAVKKAQATLTDKKNTLSGKTRVDDAIYKDTQSKIRNAEKELVKKTNERQDYINSKTWKTPTSWKSSHTVQGFDKEIAAIEGRLQQLRGQLNTQMSATAFDKLQLEIQETESKVQEAKTALNDFLSKSPNTAALNTLFSELQKIDGIDLSNVTRDIQGAEQVIESLSADQINQLRTAFDKLGIELNGLEPAVDKTRDSLREGAEATAEFKQEAQELSQLKSRLMSFFGINNAVNIFQRAIRDAFNTVKELDAAMTETAVVTDYSVGDMWEQLPQYTAAANKLGTTTLGAYQTMTLFYQQGLKTNEAFAIGTETMKMARIANMDYAQATDMMTAALRGFNMELNEASAQRVNDVYSELAAITAADTEEIATAMTKTASIADSANMEFETTAALLSQIIETTREAPETAGTAMKTIIARFTEVKKLFDQGQLTGIDGEGEAININKIDEALKSVGMSLQGFLRGEEGIDDIFLQLAQKWDTLDLSTQRYIATMAAGSRQQSRFLAMMSDYDRTMELVNAANNSAGASQKQFEKTIESLESKLNKLKNAWDEFTMGLANSKLVKGAVDIFTGILNTANKITNVFGGGLLSSILKVGLALNALKFGKILIGASSVQVPKILQSKNGQKFSKIFALDQFFDTKNGPEGKEEEAGNTFLTSVIAAGKKWISDVVSAGNIEKANAVEEGVIENASAVEENAIENAGATAEAVIETAGAVTENKIEQAGAIVEEAIEAKGGINNKQEKVFGKPGLGSLLGGKAGIAKLLPKAGIAALVIAAIAAVVGTAYNKSLAGRTKDAERINKAIQESAQATRDSITQMRSLREAYTESQNKIQEAENFQERNQAIAESNKKLLEIIKQNPELMEEVSWGEDGQIKIDTKGLDDAITRLDGVLNGVEFAEDMSQVSLKGLALERTQELMQILEQDYINETATASLSAEREREFELRRAELYNQEQINRLEMQNTVQSAFGNIIPKNVSDELASQLLYTIAANFDATAFSYAAKGQVQGGLNWGGTDWWGRTFGEYGFFGTWANGSIDEQYEKLFGPAAVGMSRKDKIDAIAQRKASDAEIEKFSDYVEAVQGNAELQKLVALASGEYTGEIEEIGSIDKEDWKAAWEYLGAKEGESLEDFKARQADEYNKLRQSTREGLYTSLISNGFSEDSLGIVNGMTYADQKEMLAVLNKMEGLSSEAIQAAWLNIPDMLANNAEDYQKYFANIDFNNPIRASKQLNNAIESGIPHVQAYAEALKASDKSFFGTRSQLSYLLSSEEYAELNEQLNGFIESSGEISAANIIELADECEILKDLMDETEMSAAGLAKALDLVQKGELGFHQLTDSVLSTLSAFDSLDSVTASVLNKFKNFDAGIDENEIAGFIKTAYETVNGNLEKGAYGNSQNRKYLEFLFGPDALSDLSGNALIERQKYLADFLEQNQDNMYASWEKLAQGQNILGGSTNLGNLTVTATDGKITVDGYENFQSTADFVAAVAKAFGVTETYAEAMVADFKNYSSDAAAYFYTQDEGIARDRFLESGQGIFDESEIIAYGKIWGQTAADELRNQIRRDSGVITDYYDENGAVRSTEDIWEQLEKNYVQGSRKSNLDEYFSSEEYKVSKYSADFAKAFDFKGVFDLDSFYDYLSDMKVPESAWDGLASSYISSMTKNSESVYGEIVTNIEGQSIKIPLEYEGQSPAEAIANFQKSEEWKARMQDFANALANVQVGVTAPAPGTLADIGTTISTTVQSNLSTVILPVAWGDPGPAPTGGASRATGGIVAATGGIVPSYARGSEQYKLTPGPALTGEEDPEIIWNKERGYAYLAGANGPEYNVLRSGDRVFNASETKKILRNSRRNKRPALASGGYLGGQLTASYAATGYGDAVKPGTNGNISTGKVDNTGKEDWRNEFDWLYNLMEDITELERDQNKLQEQYDDYLEDINATAQDLVNVTQSQLSNLYTQLEHQTLAFDKRNQEMREYLEANNKYIEYGTYNFEDQTIEIDWDKIEGITDEALYKEVEEFVNGLEEVQDKIDEADDALIDIQNEIQEIQERFIKEYIDFEKRVIDAMVSERKEQIDALSKINDSLSDTNSRLLDAVQKSLDKQRQDRENTKTEEDIAEKERRLAFLRQDTSGNNQLEIKALEKELGEMKEDYTDELVDQKMTELQEQQDAAAEQRERQIALMESQLEYEQKTGKLWEDMHSLFFDAIGAGGKLDTESALAELLRGQEEWEGMSDTEKQQWLDDLIGEFNSAYAYILSQDINSEQLAKDAYDYTYSDIAPKLPEHSQAQVAFGDKESGGSSGSGKSNNYIPASLLSDIIDDKKKKTVIAGGSVKYIYKYATGGLADFTGPAWLDGTKSRPELVLNARDTENFIQLKDILSSVLRGGAGSEESSKGDTYIDISVQANLQNDYDTEQLVRKVKSEIYKDGAYRGVNIIHNIR